MVSIYRVPINASYFLKLFCSDNTVLELLRFSVSKYMWSRNRQQAW